MINAVKSLFGKFRKMQESQSEEFPKKSEASHERSKQVNIAVQNISEGILNQEYLTLRKKIEIFLAEPLPTKKEIDINPYLLGGEYFFKKIKEENDLSMELDLYTEGNFVGIQKLSVSLAQRHFTYEDLKEYTYKRQSEWVGRILEANIDSWITNPSKITKKHIQTINKNTSKYAYKWEKGELSEASLEKYIAIIKQHGSGKGFFHSFPEISIKKGYIATTIGAGEDYQSVRGDSISSINFSCEDYIYGTYGDIKGGVFFPAELLLSNYPFYEIPYRNDLSNLREWRTVAPPNNPKSSLHKIPLKQGICFFDKKDKEHIETLLSDSKTSPNKIIWYDTQNGYFEDDAFNEFMKQFPKTKDLPHLSNPIDVLNPGASRSILGTKEAKDNWYKNI